MMREKILLLALLLCFAMTAMADLVDNFDVAHDYLTEGPGSYTGILNSGNATILDASTTTADMLHMQSVGGWGGGDTSGPFLYKEVTGDFVAEVKVDAANWELYAAGGLLVRLGDTAAGGAGEDNMFLAYWPHDEWGVGTIFWPTDNDGRPEYANSGYNSGDIPTYLRVERRGAEFYWSRSSDGVSWEQIEQLPDLSYPLVRDDMNVATLQVGLVQVFGDWSGGNDISYEYFNITEQVTAFSGTTTVSEGGGSTTITVDLIGPAPTEPVDVVLTEVTTTEPNDLLLDGALSPLTLSFGIGETQKSFTIQAVDDALQEGPEVVHIAAEMSSADSNYAGHPGGTIYVKVIDNEPGLLIDEGDGIYVDEDGTISDSLSIMLSTQPTADVTVTISTDGQVNATSPLVFTSSDWNKLQSVTVTGVDDTDLETDPHTGTLSFSSSSDDLNYEGVTAFDVEAAIAENECGAWGYSPYDYNEDCVVNLADLAQLASQWTQCTSPYAVGCIDVR